MPLNNDQQLSTNGIEHCSIVSKGSRFLHSNHQRSGSNPTSSCYSVSALTKWISIFSIHTHKLNQRGSITQNFHFVCNILAMKSTLNDKQFFN